MWTPNRKGTGRDLEPSAFVDLLAECPPLGAPGLAAGKASQVVMALARRHAAARPDALGFLYIDGHARVSWPAG